MTLWQPGMRMTDSRLNDGIDPTITTTGLVAATDFTVNDFYGSKSGRSVFVHVHVAYTNATAVTPAGQNISDMAMATLPSGWRPPEVINAIAGNGSMNGEVTIGTSGQITLRSIGAAFSSSNGPNFRITAEWNAV